MCHPSCMDDSNIVFVRRVWRYQRGNWNRYIEKERITQRPKEKVQKDKQRSTKHTHKTKYRVTWTPLKTGGELRCSGRLSSSCSTSKANMKHYVKYNMTNANQRLIWACFALVVITISHVVNMLTVTFNGDHTQVLRKAKQFLLYANCNLRWWPYSILDPHKNHIGSF